MMEAPTHDSLEGVLALPSTTYLGSSGSSSGSSNSSNGSPTTTITLGLDHDRNLLVALAQHCAYAIHLGSPLYNQGATQECAALYEEAIKAIIETHATPGYIIKHLCDALDNSQSLVSASRRAWALRNSLDMVLNVVASPSLASSPTPTEEPVVEEASGWSSVSRAVRPARRAQHPEPAPPASQIASPASSASPFPSIGRSDSSGGGRCLLLALPEDVAELVLLPLSSRDLGQLSGTCSALRRRAHARAESMMRAYQPMLFRSLASGERVHAGAWVRSLCAVEQLVARVGPRPHGRNWWNEWVALRLAEGVHTGDNNTVDPRSFRPGGERSIKALLRQYAAGLSWMVDAGWTPLNASATMLLLACGSTALGQSIRTNSTEFAASAHALLSALRQRARGISTPAPPSYASLADLAAADPAWLALVDHPSEATGDEQPNLHMGDVHIVTNAPLQASLFPRQPTQEQQPQEQPPQPPQPQVQVGAAADAQVADGDDVEVWEDLGSPGPLVCFLSERRGPGDVLSTLIQISPITFALPPISTIRLVADHPANGWQLGDHTMTRRCLCVTARVVY